MHTRLFFFVTRIILLQKTVLSCVALFSEKHSSEIIIINAGNVEHQSQLTPEPKVTTSSLPTGL